MWKSTKPYLIVASVTLNLAFVAMWIAYAAPSQAHPEETGQRATQHTIWCPLHRELDVTEEQWARIEPRLREFQAAVGELCQEVNAKRSEVIDLIADDEPDRTTIRAKQDEILATKRSIQDLVADHLVAEKEILTLKQQQRLFKMLRDRTYCEAGPPMAGRAKGGPGPSRSRLPSGTSNNH
jgi:Spy/CpxP family protein refolding chaperone